MTQRRCGDCTLCCRLLPVLELSKRHNERCQHQFSGGCRIYDGRPPSCRAWSCAWMVRQGYTANLRRPDRAHYVVDPIFDTIKVRDNETGETYGIRVVQVWVEAGHRKAPEQDPGLIAMLDRLGMPALLRLSPTEAYVLVPPCLSEDGKVHVEYSPMLDDDEMAKPVPMASFKPADEP